MVSFVFFALTSCVNGISVWNHWCFASVVMLADEIGHVVVGGKLASAP